MHENGYLQNVGGQMRWIPAFFLFAAASVILYLFSGSSDLDKYEPVLIMANITMAVFSVNFAFAVYQSSDYKQFHTAVSSPQIYAFLFVLFLAMSPLFAVALAVKTMAPLAMSVFPLVAVSSVILLVVAKRETNAVTVLRRRASKRHVQRFAALFFKEADKTLLEFTNLALSDLRDMPMHEWGWYVPPDAKSDDPFNVIAGVSSVAIAKGDVYAFQRALERGLSSADVIGALQPEKTRVEAYKIKEALDQHVAGALRGICNGTIASDSSGVFLGKFLDVGASYLARKATAGTQTSERSLLVLSLMQLVAESCLEAGRSDSALVPLVVMRQVVQKGMDNPPSFKADGHGFDRDMFDHALSKMPYMVMDLGRAAIKLGNSNFLYRCLDSYGWLGCSAIKRNHDLVGRTCLRALVQLGREARAAGLECFWDRCALTPTDHAQERIEGILTWLHTVPEADREGWLRFIQEAYSRITGWVTEIEVTYNESSLQYSISVSKKPHVLGYSNNRRGGSLDYSDFSVLKDFELI